MTELDHTGRNEYRDLIYMERQSRAYKILKNDPDCVPILIERYEHELHLPLCRRTKIILKKNAQVSEIIEYLRNDMKLHGNQTLYLMTNGYYEYDMKKSVGQLYEEAQDDDGFLYMTYIIDFRNVPQYVGNQLFTENEAKHVLFAAKTSREKGNLKKALVIIENALAKAPKHPEILMEYGIIIESTSKDLVLADSIYYKVLNCDPNHEGALMRRQKILPVVLAYDNRIIKELYVKRESFYKIKKNVSAFRRALRESYYQHVYHTVALEGNTMSYIQTRTFLETGRAIGGKSIFEHNEILGLDAALRFLNQSKIQLGAITLSDILQIHHKVLAFVDPDNAGKFRDVQVYIGPFTPPGPEFVVNEMKQFIDWLNDEASLEMDCVELAAIAHYKFVFIHPFIDGNGRTGRLLMNLILSRSGFPPIIIPVEERLTYYQALKEANDGDLRPFIRFIVSQTDKTLQKFIDSVSTCTSDTEDCLDEPGQRIEIPEDTDKNRLDATK
uniref:Protein adenylyltransferase n=1 Tax=Rhabditophanes sp. KR3021 TaxID=114890 RepID=A0AC35TZ58_9BILA